MVWYLGQSLIMLGASFAFGLLVGWAVWRLPWRKRRFGESDVIAALNRQHTLEVAERDERIARLQDELSARGIGGNGQAANLQDAQHQDARYLGAGAPVVETGAAADPSADFPEAWMADDLDSSLDGPALLLDDAHVEPPGPRPPALFPAPGDVRATSPGETAPEGTGARQGGNDAVPRDEVDLRDAPAPSAQEMPSHHETDERGVADLRGDDLTRIVGISPDIAGSLQAAGLHTYQDLASARPHQVDSALETGRAQWTDLRRTWPRQAQLLADGDETGFDRLARGLITDREITRGL